MALSLLIAGALLAPAPADAPRLLRTNELRTKVRGSTITRINSFPGAPLEREYFWVGGRYGGEFDNYEAYGSYRIASDEVCVRAEGEKEGCFSILVDGRGQYWMSTPTSGGPFRVTIAKIVDRP
jgi:hypothetical protein